MNRAVVGAHSSSASGSGRHCDRSGIIVDATSSHAEGIDSLQSRWYRGARAGKTFAHFAYGSSDRHMKVSFCTIESARLDIIDRLCCSLPVTVAKALERKLETVQ